MIAVSMPGYCTKTYTQEIMFGLAPVAVQETTNFPSKPF